MRHNRLFSMWLLAAGASVMIAGAAAAGTHAVRPGDTLWSLSRKYGVSQEAIARANGLKLSATLKLGKSLAIPGKSGASSRKVSSSASASQHGKVAVVAKSAPLRSEPSASGRRLGVLHAGAKVRVVSSKWHWHQVVTASGNHGWVGDYMLKVQHPAPAPVRVVSAAPVRKYHHAAVSHSHRSVRVAHRSSSRASRFAAAAIQGTSNAVKTAMDLLGCRYRFGGTSRGGFDCSGFTRHVYGKQGVSLPHSSAAQFSRGQQVSRSALKPGDLVFFASRGRRVGHVGIYAGNGKFVHASNPHGGVKVDSLNSGHYASRFAGARRVAGK